MRKIFTWTQLNRLLINQLFYIMSFFTEDLQIYVTIMNFLSTNKNLFFPYMKLNFL